MPQLVTATGKKQFEYTGTLETGLEFFYGDGLRTRGRVSAETIDALLAEFASRPGLVDVGTSFNNPRLGTIGDWLMSREKPNLACYLVPTLEHLGVGAYDTTRRRFSFTGRGGDGNAGVPDARAPSMPTERFDGGSLATEAGKSMARVAEEVSGLALSPVQRIECSLSDFADVGALRLRLNEWNLPDEREFVLYRFQTDAPEEFHAAFPESTACTYKLSRKNELTDDGVTLYVGSSRSFASRLQQHFGFGAERTYALHLNRWVPETLRETTLVLEYWTVRDGKQVRPVVLQALEDYLWDHSQPVFGRRGSK